LPAIVNNPDLVSSSNLVNIFSNDFWGENLTSSQSHKSYRPLTTLTFWMEKQISEKSFSFHLTNILVHGANCHLAFKIYREFFSLKKSFLAAIMFAIHPIHVESVAGIVGRADILYSLFALAGILLAVKTANASFNFFAISSLCFISTLCKEQGIMLIPMILSIEVLVKHQLKIFPIPKCAKKQLLFLKFLIYALLFGGIIYWRMSLVNFSPPTFQVGDNPFAFIKSAFLKWINLTYIYSINAWILLAPDWLCFDWAFHCIRPIDHISDPRICFLILFVSIFFGLILISAKRNDSKVLLNLSFLILPFLPASNIVFTVGFVIAERNLYLCVFGYAGLIISGFRRLETKFKSKKYRKCLKFFSAFVLLTFAAKSWIRSIDWQTEDQLYSSGLRVCPNNAKIFYNLAKLSADGATSNPDKGDSEVQRSRAIHHYKKALNLWPDYEQALNNLGNLYRQVIIL
jgi:tetratricopeptide (TPR) repeat protein